MLPADYVPQVGDVVVLHATVTRDGQAGDDWIMIDFGYQQDISRRFFVAVHKRASDLKSGDTVMLNNDDTYTPKIVRGVFDGYVWISDQAGHQMRTVTSDLVHRVTDADHL